jgi:hypothetical protein
LEPELGPELEPRGDREQWLPVLRRLVRANAACGAAGSGRASIRGQARRRDVEATRARTEN